MNKAHDIFYSISSDLVIEEIDGEEYYIDEYDGKETIVTPDNFGWIVIS